MTYIARSDVMQDLLIALEKIGEGLENQNQLLEQLVKLKETEVHGK